MSLEETSVCVVDQAGKVVREAKVLSDPEAISQWLKATGLRFARVGLEAGPLAPWLFRGLVAQALPAACIETRRMKAFAGAAPVKTDRKDAHLIAQAMRVGLYREVHVKSEASQELRVLLRNRWTLSRKRRDLDNEVRGTLKGFGLKVGKVGAKRLAHRVRDLVADNEGLATITEPMLRVRAVLLEQEAVLDRLVVRAARSDEVCRLLMTAPGIGPVVALAYRTGVDAPGRFAKSRNVGAHFGLTPRTYASGEVDRRGRISKCGDAMVRSLLFEAALSLLTRVKTWSALKSWGMRIAKRRGLRRAQVAVARRLAVILHRMWTDGTEFCWRRQDAEASA